MRWDLHDPELSAHPPPAVARPPGWGGGGRVARPRWRAVGGAEPAATLLWQGRTGHKIHFSDIFKTMGHIWMTTPVSEARITIPRPVVKNNGYFLSNYNDNAAVSICEIFPISASIAQLFHIFYILSPPPSFLNLDFLLNIFKAPSPLDIISILIFSRYFFHIALIWPSTLPNSILPQHTW